MKQDWGYLNASAEPIAAGNRITFSNDSGSETAIKNPRLSNKVEAKNGSDFMEMNVRPANAAPRRASSEVVSQAKNVFQDLTKPKTLMTIGVIAIGILVLRKLLK